MRRRITANADNAGVGEITEFVRSILEEYGIKKKEVTRAALTVEESAGSLAAHAAKDSKISVCVRAFLGTVTIEMSCMGESYSLSASLEQTEGIDSDTLEDGGQEVLRNILLNSLGDHLKYRHRSGKNRIQMVVVRSKRAFLYQTLGAMLLGILAGLFLTMLPAESFAQFLNEGILVPVKTIYMNALKMLVAPVVFFSIVSCIVQYSNLTELGRVGGRVILMYLLTTVIAVGVGLGAFFLFRPGSPISGEIHVASAEAITSQKIDVSLVDTIINIVPTNSVQPFLKSEMLQLIFLAVLCGVAAGQIGRYSDTVKELFEAFNDLFLKMTTIVIRFMPIAVFCSICSMMLSTGAETLLSVLSMFGVFLFGLVCMMVVYTLLMMILSGLNPIPFFRRYASTMVQVFSVASSNAAIPINMNACANLGISKKIYSLSIPLGATLNMDGTCIHLAVFAMALAKMYDVPISGIGLGSIIISIIVLSMGAPGVPGSGLICLSVLLAQLNVPVEAIGLVMGIDTLAGMFRTMSNCLGDVAVSMIVAKQQGALDMNAYQGQRG